MASSGAASETIISCHCAEGEAFGLECVRDVLHACEVKLATKDPEARHFMHKRKRDDAGPSKFQRRDGALRVRRVLPRVCAERVHTCMDSESIRVWTPSP